MVTWGSFILIRIQWNRIKSVLTWMCIPLRIRGLFPIKSTGGASIHLFNWGYVWPMDDVWGPHLHIYLFIHLFRIHGMNIPMASIIPQGKKTGHRCPFPIGWLIHTGVWWNPFNNRIQQVNDVRWYTKPGVSKARGLHGPPGLPWPQLRSATNSASCGDGGCGGDVGDADATRWNAWGQGWGHVFFCFFLGITLW